MTTADETASSGFWLKAMTSRFGPPTDRPPEMQRGGGRSARQHEGAQRRQIGVQAVDLALRALDLGLDDARGVCRARLIANLRREVGANVEEVVLNASEHGVDVALGVQASDPDAGVRLVKVP